MAAPVANKIEDIPTITFEELMAKVRQVGVDVADGSIPTALPSTELEQWALLKPYVGRPLKDIPKGLILLFTSTQGDAVTGQMAQAGLRALPPAERQARTRGVEDDFI